ncbi:MAG: hypothetical protein IKR73_03870, partial [Oscillospiraceae bacterium]|nr:hypothetical protein [Oscillospiraceae bacterium]
MKNNDTPVKNNEKEQKKKGFRLGSIIENDKALTVLSIFIAIIVWAVVSINQFPTVQKKYANVPVIVDLKGSYTQSLGLEVVNITDETVTVVLEGDRATMGELTIDDLYAVADVGNVLEPGEKALELEILSTNGATFTTKSIDPPTAKVEFDEIVTKEFKVE